MGHVELFPWDTSTKSIDPCQSVPLSQADMGRNCLLFVNCLYLKFLTLSSLMTTQEAFVGSVDQYQTAQNVQSDL